MRVNTELRSRQTPINAPYIPSKLFVMIPNALPLSKPPLDESNHKRQKLTS